MVLLFRCNLDQSFYLADLKSPDAVPTPFFDNIKPSHIIYIHPLPFYFNSATNNCNHPPLILTRSCSTIRVRVLPVYFNRSCHHPVYFTLPGPTKNHLAVVPSFVPCVCQTRLPAASCSPSVSGSIVRCSSVGYCPSPLPSVSSETWTGIPSVEGHWWTGNLQGRFLISLPSHANSIPHQPGVCFYAGFLRRVSFCTRPPQFKPVADSQSLVFSQN